MTVDVHRPRRLDRAGVRARSRGLARRAERLPAPCRGRSSRHTAAWLPSSRVTGPSPTSVIPRPWSRRAATRWPRGSRSSRTSSKLGSELPPELGISELQARAGIHTGEVLVAAVTAGGPERLPDVWGQVPNMAARLQAAGEPGQIVISGDTADLVAGFFDLEPLGCLTFKGIGQPVPAFRVLRRSGARHRLEARPLTGFIPAARRVGLAAGAMGQVAERDGTAGSGLGRTGNRQVAAPARVQPGARAREGTPCGRSSAAAAARSVRCSRSATSWASPGHAVRGRGVGRGAGAAGGPAAPGRGGRALGRPQHAGSGFTCRPGQAPDSRADECRPEIADDPHVQPDDDLELGRLSPRRGARPARDGCPSSAASQARHVRRRSCTGLTAYRSSSRSWRAPSPTGPTRRMPPCPAPSPR